MSINIDELKIKISTNISDSKSKIIEFKRSMLYHPDLIGINLELNEYPYFTFDVKYPLFSLKYLTYKDRVEFFFNKEKFNNTLLAFSKEKGILDITKVDSKKEEEIYNKRKEKNIEKNIIIMLELLFPTKFPVINDIQTSYNIIQGNIKLKNVELNPIIPFYYSYLKINEEIYTIKKNIWINDILNHPEYQRLIIEYYKIWTILEEIKIKIKKEYYENNDETKEQEKNDRLEKINEYFKSENPSGDKKYPTPLEYTIFKNMLINYRKPRRESTNQELQEIINLSGSTDVTEFYKFMKFLHDRYFKIGKNIETNLDYNKYKKKLKVGLCIINTDVLDTPKREIYIYTDFIKGEVNINNEKNIWCPFVGDYLGNQLERIIFNFNSKKNNNINSMNWNILKNRMIFSIKKSKSESSNKSLMIEEKPLKKSENYTTNDRNPTNDKENSNINIILKTNFIKIIKDNDEIKKILNEINKTFIMFLKDLNQLSEQNLLEFIKKNKKEIFILIEKWNKDPIYKNDKLLSYINEILSKITRDLRNTEDNIARYTIIPGKIQELNKEKYNKILLTLYLLIINIFDKLERKKNIRQQGFLRQGGTKKKFFKGIRYTRKL